MRSRPHSMLLPLLGALLALPSSARADPGPWAGPITRDNFEQRRVGGPDADAGIGDWALGNGTLCAAVSHPDHESPLSPAGGVLIDLGHCGREDDQWSTLQPLVNLQRSEAVAFDSIEGGVEGETARIVTSAPLAGARLTTTYTLSSREPEVLRIVTEIRRSSSEGWLLAYGDVVLHASGQLRPFALLRRDPSRSPGFHHPGGEFTGITGALQALVAADAHILVGSEGFPPISYGLVQDGAWRVRGDGNREVVPTFANSSQDHSMVGYLAGSPWLGTVDPPGWVALSQLPFLGLAPGEALVIERSLHVGERRDVASITDRLFAPAPTLRGRTHPGASVLVSREAAPVTAVRADEEGAFELVLPPGRYGLQIRTPWIVLERIVALGPEGTELEPILGDAPAVLSLPRGRVARLVFVGEGATDTPRFGDDGFDVRVGDRPADQSLLSNTVSLIGSDALDPASVELAPGDYRVLATRGLEFGVTETRLSLAPGERARLEIAEPRRVVETPGWIAADLHVHSAESYDSGFPLERQLAAFAAFGGEVLVASEHDRVFDPRPAIRRLGLATKLVGLVGVEITGSYQGGDAAHTIGHLNAFPVGYERTAPRGGAPQVEGRRLRDVLSGLRSLPERPIAQLNHPRAQRNEAADGAYFSHLAVAGRPYDPARSLSTRPNSVLMERGAHGLRDLDYDAVELLNGPSLERYRWVRADWLSLQRQGIRHVATGNSDTHRAGVIPALPRNYVPVPDDRIRAFDAEAFLGALRAGRSFATTGPMLHVALEGEGPGGLFTGAEGVLSVRIDAAPWVEVEDLRIYVNGELAHRRTVRAGDTFEHRLKFEAGDAFVTVEVEGQTSSVYRAVAPGFTPFAFVNPIFVDADADGGWTPPGMDGPLPAALTDPLGSP